MDVRNINTIEVDAPTKRSCVISASIFSHPAH